MKYRHKIAAVYILIALIMGMVSQTEAATGMRNMLNLTGARQAAMGETPTVFEPDPFNLEYNPAAIYGMTKGKVGFSHNQYILDRHTSSLAAIFPIEGIDFGLHLRMAGVGDIEVREGPSSEPDYIAGANEFAVKAFSAFRIVPRLRAGVSLGWMMEKIDIQRASAVTFGFGLAYYSKYDVAIHAAASNLGGKLKFIEQEDDPPSMYRGGLSINKFHLSATAEYVSVKSGEGHMHFGAEYLIREMLFLRAGYQTGYDNRDFSAGAGFVYKTLRIDYAFVPYQSDLGSSHRFTLTYGIK
jgi:hypothetical protein